MSGQPAPSKTHVLLDQPAALSAWLRAAFAQRDLALDVEGDGMFRYKPRVCVVQLAVEDTCCIADTLTPGLLPLLGPILSAPSPRKIVHDLGFDARLLSAEGIALNEVFDTALAARFLGYPETGLASLVHKLSGVRLPKQLQQRDWGERPLDEEAQSYLAGDVAYLHDLAAWLFAQLCAHDIVEETREETRYLLERARRSTEAVPPWLRIKGAGQLSPPQRARLYLLAEEREALSAERDLPAGRLMASARLLRLAQTGNADSLAKLDDLEVKQRLSHALALARELSDAPAHHLARAASAPLPPGQLHKRRRRKAALQAFRQTEAEARGVVPQVVLPGHCLEDLIRTDTLDERTLRGVAGFGECRIERYGRGLISQFSGAWDTP